MSAKWLSPRECETINLLATRSSFTWVAMRMNVRPGTARNFARTAYRKLGVHRKEDAVAKHGRHTPSPSRECARGIAQGLDRI